MSNVVTNETSVTIDVQIDNDSDIASLDIYRATNNTDTTFYETISYTGSAYTDNNVVTYQDYWYLARAKDNQGNYSYYSNRVFGNPHDSILEVPQEFATIQLALNAAYPGDVVLVDDGTYQENLVWPQVDNVTMRSINGRDQTTVDGSGNTESCIYVQPQTQNVKIDGFKLMNGVGTIPQFS